MRLIFSFLIFMVLCVPSFAEGYRVKDRLRVDSDEDNLHYCYELQEKLRVLHNEKGMDLREGTITQGEFDKWKRDVYYPYKTAIIEKLMKHKEALQSGDRFSVDLSSDLEEQP
jgi:hypothetical protein